jgi:cytoskeletal protein CcmA (bactofilin family)
MNNEPVDANYAPDQQDNSWAPAPMQGLAVNLGTAQPPEARAIPVLQPDLQALDGDAARHCTIAEGMQFEGNAQLIGPCSVGGEVRGNLVQAPGSSIAVVITETGQVTGDVRAQKISVMGRTSGTLDASGGLVSINDTASVSGHVRYGRLQVNGADLNATLERVAVAPDQYGNKGMN